MWMTRSRTTRLTRDGTGMCCGQVMHGLPLKQCARQSANVQALSHFPSTSQMGTPRIVWPRLCSTAPRAPSMQVMWTWWADAGKVGSRAMQRLVADGPDLYLGWVDVQMNRYRYLAIQNCDVMLVRMVIGGYLAGEVIWEDE